MGHGVADAGQEGRECRRRSSVLPLKLPDTAASSQDGSSLAIIAAIAGR